MSSQTLSFLLQRQCWPNIQALWPVSRSGSQVNWIIFHQHFFGRFFEELLNYMEDIRDVRASSTKFCQENTRVSSGRIWEVPRFQNPFYLQARKQ